MEPHEGQAKGSHNISNEFHQESRTASYQTKLQVNTLGDIAAEVAEIYNADRVDFKRAQGKEPAMENTTGFITIQELLLMEAEPTPGEQIAESILRDFCSSPTYFEENHEPATETSPWFRFRHKKIKTYSRRRILKEEPPPVTLKYEVEEEEDRLSCSSGLSVQEDYTTPATTSVCELDANTSQKICENLLNLSEYFSLGNPNTPSNKCLNIDLPSKKETSLQDSSGSKEKLSPMSDTQSSVEYSAIELKNLRDELLESDYTFEASQNCDIKPRGDTIFGGMESIKNTDSKVCEDWSEGDSFLESINTEQISLKDDKCEEIESKTGPSEIKSENYEILLDDIPITEWQTPMDIPEETNIESKESAKDETAKSGCSKDITDTQFLQEFPLEEWQPEEASEFVGFRTASNKKIQISEETKARAAKLMADLDAEEVQQENFKESDKVPEFLGFRTASNKAINISEETRKRAAKFMADFEAEEHRKDTSNEDPETIPEFVGFRTASNKAIEISEETKLRAAAFMANLEAEDPQKKSDDGNSAKLDDFVGFRTASNKAIEISKEMESKGAKFLAQFKEENEQTLAADTEFLQTIAFSQWEPLDIPDTVDTRTDKADHMEIKATTSDNHTSTSEAPADTSVNTSQSATIPQLVAFHKTSFKFMEISQEMRTKGDQLMADVIAGKPSPSRSLDTSGIVGFRTASNKPIEITKEMKKKAAKLIAEVEAGEIKQQNIEKAMEDNEDFGFKTASNKKIVVSEEMQKKAAKFMAEIQANENQVNENQITAEGEFFGFRTASNKSITVSEEMKKKAAKLFAEVEAQESSSNVLSSQLKNNKEQPQVQVEPFENIETTKDTCNIVSNIECPSDVSDELSGEEFKGFPNNDIQEDDSPQEFVFPRQSQVNVPLSDSRVGTPKHRRETSDGIPSSKRRRGSFSQKEQPGGSQLVKTISCNSGLGTPRNCSQKEQPGSHLIRTTSCNSALATPSQSQEMHASLTQLASRSPLDRSTKTSVIARRNLLTLSKRRKRNSTTSEPDGIETPLKPRFAPMAASTSTPLANKNTNLRQDATKLQQNVEDMSPICMPPNKSRRLGLSRSRY
ncbi:breast cancer type 2 susceptibility protein homolog [Drosophila bipectinata]|uniref:breast cancer type 2 susceptibility protein homolog n=1 Tax=Drosophila bipectinata TaxID=42026 RepID=UPI0038B2BF35